MFLILEGEGELRFGQLRYPLRAMDVIACPPGGAEVAHQIINTGLGPLRYLAVSTLAPIELAEYPDSGKIGVYGGVGNAGGTWRASDKVDYYDGETI